VWLHIVGFIAGGLVASAVVFAVSWAVGLPGWGPFGMAVASFVLAQILYVLWLVLMARGEARRRRSATADSLPRKQPRSAVQKG
jgi:uncharacterized membrane protein